MQSLQIEQITYSDFEKMLSEIVRKEFKHLAATPEPKDKGTFASRKEVAKELKISLPTLIEYTKNGTLTGYRIGGRILYKWTEIFDSVERIQTIKGKGGAR